MILLLTVPQQYEEYSQDFCECNDPYETNCGCQECCCQCDEDLDIDALNVEINLDFGEAFEELDRFEKRIDLINEKVLNLKKNIKELKFI